MNQLFTGKSLPTLDLKNAVLKKWAQDMWLFNFNPMSSAIHTKLNVTYITKLNCILFQ